MLESEPYGKNTMLLKPAWSTVFAMVWWSLTLDFQQFTRCFITGSAMTVVVVDVVGECAGGDASQSHEVTPAEGRSGQGELFSDGSVVLLAVQAPVFADGVLQH